jgi:hypothetical protein
VIVSGSDVSVLIVRAVGRCATAFVLRGVKVTSH